MSSPDLARIAAELQKALECRVQCGQIVLNLNEGVVSSVEVTIKRRVVARKPIDGVEAHAHGAKLTSLAVLSHS